MIRALQPFSTRKRYIRGSTSRYGHTLPLTSMWSPKYSPIQVTPGMSLTGYRNFPSARNWRSWMTSGISYAPPGIPIGLGSVPVSWESRIRYPAARPANTFSRVVPIPWSWNQRSEAGICGSWLV